MAATKREVCVQAKALAEELQKPIYVFPRKNGPNLDQWTWRYTDEFEFIDDGQYIKILPAEKWPYAETTPEGR